MGKKNKYGAVDTLKFICRDLRGGLGSNGGQEVCIPKRSLGQGVFPFNATDKLESL